MAKSSSISSSRTLDAFPRPTGAVWVAVAVFAMVRLGLWYACGALFYIPENDFDKLYLDSESRYRLSSQASPKVIVMGTSRLGILSRECMAAQLGLEPSEVANYSLAGNSYWRTLAFFRRNPRILERAQVVVMDILPYQLFEGPLFPENDELFLRLATPAERWEVRDPVNRLRAFADLLVPTWSERHNPGGWYEGLRLLGMDAEARCRAYREALQRPGGIAKVSGGLHDEARAAGTPRDGAGYAPEPRVSRVQVAALRELQQFLPENCRLVLAWLPVREDFAAELHNDPVMKSSYAVFREFMQTLNGPRVTIIWLDNDGGRIFSRGEFRDVVHFSDSGIEKTCVLLSDEISRTRGSR